MSNLSAKNIENWIAEYFAGAVLKPNLIAALLAMQKKFGYLPKRGMKHLAEKLSVSPANVYAVATFYNSFRFTPPGKYALKICTGTACHIKQATQVLEHWQRRLDIQVGEVTSDGEYSLDRVACVGCCTLAPVIVLGEEVIGDMSPTKIDGILLQHQLKREQADTTD